MKSKRIFLLAILIILAVTVLYVFQEGGGSQVYIDRIVKERVEKDDFFKTKSGSPLSQEEKEKFKGLNYFQPNKNYEIQAKIQEFDIKETVRMKTTQGGEEIYIKFAKALFEVNEREQELVVYKPMRLVPGKSKNYMFVPFFDATCGNESYESGRYLDFTYNANVPLNTLDFNLAYNPYCAYNESYECPLPPKENHLQVEIPAGEKKFKN